jgi:hypothetical protein
MCHVLLSTFGAIRGGNQNTRGQDEALIRYIMLVRMLRMLRIFGGVERFAIVFQVFLELLPVFSSLFGILFLMMYHYAQLGIGIFGGKVSVISPPRTISRPRPPNA